MNIGKIIQKLAGTAMPEVHAEAPPPRVDKGLSAIHGHEVMVQEKTDEQKAFIATCYANYLTPIEIIQAYKERYGVEFHKNQIYKIIGSKKWAKLVTQIRESYHADLSAVAGAHKRVRLERADRVYARAVGVEDLDVQLKSVEQQRKEMEGKDQGSLSITFNKFNMMADEDLENAKLEIIQRLKAKGLLPDNNGGQNGTG